MNASIKIAITGGPSGGKTMLIEALRKELGNKCAVVQEAATILYSGGFPRKKDYDSRIHTQRAIYYTQRELEDIISHMGDNTQLIICDRGSLDSIAYWPDRENNFYESLQTNKLQELARYDWVLHLDTAAAEFYDLSNPIRTESYSEALDLNEKIKQAWQGHPRRIIIPHMSEFISKMTISISVIKAILNHESMEEISRRYLKSA